MKIWVTRILSFGAGLGLIAIGSSCGSSTPAATTIDPSAAVTAIQAGVKAAGTGIASTSRVTPTACDVHGDPTVSQSSGSYPGYLTYCFMTVDDGDTVLGGFDTAAFVSCLITQVGLVFDGAAHVFTISTAMIAACNATGSGLTDGMSVTMTGSSPASFNANYSKGVVIDLTAAIGLTFKIASNVSGTKSSFLTNESWTDLSTGTTAGSLDSSTGDLWYEARVERIGCTTSGRCGWNRHTRIRALLTMSGTTPTGLSTISFAYSNIQSPPGQSGFGGLLVTANGDLTNGIKGRYWASTNGIGGQPAALSDYSTVSKWVETPNSACYTHASDAATTCGAGLADFSTNTKFVLNTTDSPTSVTAWLAAITGQTFASVNVDSDTQF